MQIGDGGYHAQMSLFPKVEDSKTVVAAVRPGVRLHQPHPRDDDRGDRADPSRSSPQAARRAREAGCDGIEIAAHKGYLIQQFLNPGINRRTDDYGGSPEKRFRLLREVVAGGPHAPSAPTTSSACGCRRSTTTTCRSTCGCRSSCRCATTSIGNDLNQNARLWPRAGDARHRLPAHHQRLRLHPSRRKPRRLAGRRIPPLCQRHAPPEHARQSCARSCSTRCPRSLARALFGIGWRFRPTPNIDYAQAFRTATGLPVIANGGFDTAHPHGRRAERRSKCDLIALATAAARQSGPARRSTARASTRPPRPCTYCNRCSVGTAVLPLGCFDPGRFKSPEAMAAQVMWWSGGPDGSHAPAAAGAV